MTIVKACVLVLIAAVLVSAILSAVGAPGWARFAVLILIAVGAAVAMRKLGRSGTRSGQAQRES